MKTFPIKRSAKYDANLENYGDNPNTCVCCGMPTAEKQFIHANTSWEAVDEQDEAKVPNSQGNFPIGPECAKKFPPAFIFKASDGQYKPAEIQAEKAVYYARYNYFFAVGKNTHCLRIYKEFTRERGLQGPVVKEFESSRADIVLNEFKKSEYYNKKQMPVLKELARDHMDGVVEPDGKYNRN